MQSTLSVESNIATRKIYRVWLIWCVLGRLKYSQTIIYTIILLRRPPRMELGWPLIRLLKLSISAKFYPGWTPKQVCHLEILRWDYRFVWSFEWDLDLPWILNGSTNYSLFFVFKTATTSFDFFGFDLLHLEGYEMGLERTKLLINGCLRISCTTLRTLLRIKSISYFNIYKVVSGAHSQLYPPFHTFWANMEVFPILLTKRGYLWLRGWSIHLIPLMYTFWSCRVSLGPCLWGDTWLHPILRAGPKSSFFLSKLAR